MKQKITEFISDYQQYVDLVIEHGLDFGVRLMLALLVFFIGKRVARWVTSLTVTLLKKNNVDEELIGFVESMIYWGLVVMVIIAALGQLGVKTASFVAVLGAAGLAIGLALQGSLSNFASGVLILTLRPFDADDYVDIAGETGMVKRIRIFTTELRTPDNKCIIIPNSRVLDSNIVNYSSTGTRRVDMEFGVDYNDDLDKVRAVLEGLVAQDERVLKHLPAIVAVNTLADSSVNFIVRPWVKTDDYWPFYWDMTERVKKEFDVQKITIPFPQQVLHNPV